MAEKDFSHLTNDELINGIQALKLPDYIRSKGHGVDVRETLAQMTEMLMQLAYNQGMDSQEAQNFVYRINNKIDKGNVTLNDLTQEVKLALTGGSVAVVGEKSIGAEHIKDDSVTSAKQSASTQPVIVQLHQDTRVLPNYDTGTKVLNFPNGFSAIFGKRRALVSSAVSFDFTTALSSSFVAGAVLNVKSVSYRVIPLSSIATTMSDDEILIATVTNKSNSGRSVLSVMLNCPHTINNLPSGVFNAKNNANVEEVTLNYDGGKLAGVSDGVEQITLNYVANKLTSYNTNFNGLTKKTNLIFNGNLLTSIKTEVI